MSSRVRTGLPGLRVEDRGGGGLPPPALEVHQTLPAPGIDHPKVVIDIGTSGPRPVTVPSTGSPETKNVNITPVIHLATLARAIGFVSIE